ncbi:hypothetical protein M0R72_06790 [Candidatus Pacearchaeota archaeon]|jgi:hypothetical protein|nr:hypothetical protein [Candidatus Pacearchaeota archaeon]
MSKKSNPEKGLRTVSIEFAGQTRQIKFSHTAIGNLEEDANRILRANGISKDGMLFADTIVSGWLGNAKILSQVLYHGLKHEDDKISLEEIDNGIDSYIESGGKKLDLIRDIARAYKLATDPSSLASLERSWKVSDERQAMLTEAENQQMEAVAKAIADAKARLTPGSTSSESPGLN